MLATGHERPRRPTRLDSVRGEPVEPRCLLWIEAPERPAFPREAWFDRLTTNGARSSSRTTPAVPVST